jgi:transposase
VIADKAYSHRCTRITLRNKGIRVVIPEKSDQVALRKANGRAGGRPPTFDANTYRDRNVVERAFNRLKSWRGIATATTNTPATTAPDSSWPASSCSGSDDPSDTP